MLTKDLHNNIQSVIELINPEAYIVDISLNRGTRNVLNIKVDTDTGISLADCASISRKLGKLLEEDESLNFPYSLEVSSPGIGYPLHLHRQYMKNVDRQLEVKLTSGEILKGTLVDVDKNMIYLGPLPFKHKKGKAKKKKSNTEAQEIKNIEFELIQEAKVIIY